MLKGTAVSKGIAIAKVYKLVPPVLNIERKNAIPVEELTKLDFAFKKTISDIEKIKSIAEKNLTPEESAIFDAHIMMASDPEFRSMIETEIRQNGVNAEYAAQSIAEIMTNMFESMEDEYMKARAADIKDVSFRLMCNLMHVDIPDLSTLEEPVIIIAKDMTPSDTGSLNKEFAKGFATEMGGRSSHSAIMARSLEIPAVVGVNDLLNELENDDIVILDALKGQLIVHPNREDIEKYTVLAEQYKTERESLKVLKNESSVSLDNHQVMVAGNIGSSADVNGVLENGGESVGLFRTEFLYMKSEADFPDEETQFKAYKVVLQAMEGKSVVVRTLDIGGDKKLKYYQFPEETNPFLGLRAIRFCLQRKDIFKTQLRALLRASAYGHLCIMFPMIATVDEFLEAKALLEEEKQKLQCEGIAVGDNLEVGCMIEIPSAALIADQLAKYADFFSVGTNDLIQYSMAADRLSQSVSYLYQPLCPSILRLIKMTIDGAHKYGKWCGMCGEMAGDELAVPVLLGLGLDEFSISADAILPTRKIIRNLSYAEMKPLAEQCINLETTSEVEQFVKDTLGL